MIQDDLDSLLDQINAQLEPFAEGGSRNRKKFNEERKKQAVKLARSSLIDAKKLIEDMDQEARMAPVQYRSEMLNKVRQYRQNLSEINNSIRKLSETKLTDFSSVDIQEDAPRNFEGQHRQQLMQSQNLIDSAGESIQRSTRVAIETEEVGESILTDLGSQRETLERARTRLQETNEELSRSRRVIRKLYFGVIQNKVVLVIIIILEILILIGIVYHRFLS